MPIRKAIAEDISLIRTLEQQAETAAHWNARDYEALFAPQAPPRVALVAVNQANERQVYGFAIARCAPEEWEIENVVVARHLRRQGWGRGMVEELLRQAASAAVGSVLLEVRESNQPARQLYEMLGFKEVSRRVAYYQRPPEDALLLRFSITVM